MKEPRFRELELLHAHKNQMCTHLHQRYRTWFAKSLELSMLKEMRIRGSLYNSGLGKVAWFIRRFGASEVVKKPLRMLLAPVILGRLNSGSFEFRGERLQYFYHRYNMTWATERCVEIPIGRLYANQVASDDLLEIGNVLSHYGPVQHGIVDKYEKGHGIINEDIVLFSPPKLYQLVLSISTFEHIGFDDGGNGPSAPKIMTAIEKCRGLLAVGGKLVATVPIGYNPELDQLIANNATGSSQQFFLKRVGPREWSNADKREALSFKYRAPYPYANAIAVMEWLPL
jgi:hypothetical protein